MRVFVVGLVLVSSVVSRHVLADDVRIDHTPIACTVAERYPLIEARLDPAASVSAAAVHFRSGTAPQWYVVAMKGDDAGFKALLPKPKKSLDHFQYYIDATDRAFATSRTPEQTVQVASDPTGCQGRMMASGVATASILLGVPAGAPAIPAGFGSAGVATAGTAAGAAGAAGAAAGGGIGIGAVAAIVGGGAAVAGIAVAAGGGKGHDASGTNGTPTSGGPGPTPSTTVPPPANAVYGVSFGPPPGFDVSVCAGHSLQWSGQAVGVSGGTGPFDTTWAPNEPNTLHVSGTVTDTAFNANINCTSGAATGTLSATGSGGTYQGSYTLGSQRGPITVTRQ
jgi:hypothetical protein